MRSHLQTSQHFPPPIFSKSDHPHPYSFQPNSWFKIVEKSSADGTTERQFQSRKTPTVGYVVPTIPWEDEMVPQQPPTVAPTEGIVMEDVVAILRVMFENDPILSRATLEARLSKYTWPALTPYVLLLFLFNFPSTISTHYWQCSSLSNSLWMLTQSHLPSRLPSPPPPS